jgi:hypothetical protein
MFTPGFRKDHSSVPSKSREKAKEIRPEVQDIFIQPQIYPVSSFHFSCRFKYSVSASLYSLQVKLLRGRKK